MRRMLAGGGAGIGPLPYPTPPQPFDRQAELLLEQDFRRTHLAEELLKIGCEDATSADFVGLAEAALAAAEVIYPEVGEPLAIEMLRGAVARGWCTPANEKKVMDVDLASAIADSVAQLVGVPVPASAPLPDHPFPVNNITLSRTEAQAIYDAMEPGEEKSRFGHRKLGIIPPVATEGAQSVLGTPTPLARALARQGLEG